MKCCIPKLSVSKSCKQDSTIKDLQCVKKSWKQILLVLKVEAAFSVLMTGLLSFFFWGDQFYCFRLREDTHKKKLFLLFILISIHIMVNMTHPNSGTADFIQKVLLVYTNLMETIYLSLVHSGSWVYLFPEIPGRWIKNVFITPPPFSTLKNPIGKQWKYKKCLCILYISID